jgi:hypothetical protein
MTTLVTVVKEATTVEVAMVAAAAVPIAKPCILPMRAKGAAIVAPGAVRTAEAAAPEATPVVVLEAIPAVVVKVAATMAGGVTIMVKAEETTATMATMARRAKVAMAAVAAAAAAKVAAGKRA